MLSHLVVEYEEVREAREDEIEGVDAHEGDEAQGDDLAKHVIPRPC